VTETPGAVAKEPQDALEAPAAADEIERLLGLVTDASTDIAPSG
jgi:hypothetical protein